MNNYTEKLKQIYDGWKNLIFRDPEIEQMAQRRAAICANCSFNTNGVCDSNKCETIDGEEVCGCGCPLASATRSPNKKCPKNKW